MRADFHPGGAEIPASATSLYGRDDELASLVRFLDDPNHRGAVAAVHGESGIGKSTLVQALVAAARRRGWRCLSGRWYEGAGQLPYAAILEALTDLERDGHGTLVPRSRGPASPGRGSAAKLAFWTQAAALLTSACRSNPVLVVLEDGHWADMDSLHLLDFLAPRVVGLPALFCLIFRDDEDTAVVQEADALLRRLPGDSVLRLKLGPVPFPAAVAIVQDCSRFRWSLPAVRRLYEVTAGNPLFITQIATDEENNPTEALDADSLSLPATVGAVIRQRLSRLPAQCLEGVRILSVLGRDFTVRGLADLQELLPRPATSGLAEATAAGILKERPDGSIAFAHPLIRTVLYQDIDPLARCRLHGLIAEQLEALFAGQPDAAVELAYHFLRSDRRDHALKGIEYSVQAARRAYTVFAFHSAHELWRQALIMASRCGIDDARIAAWCVESAAVAEAAAAPDEGRERLRRALVYYERVGDSEAAADVNARIGWNLTVYGRRADALPYLEKAVPTMRATPSARNAELLAQYAIALISSGRMGEAGEYAEAAVAMADEVADDAARARARHLAAIWHTWDHGDPQKIPVLLSEARRFHEAASDEPLCRLLTDSAMCYLVTGDIGHAEEALAEALECARRYGHSTSEADCYALLTVIHTLRGDFDAADQAAHLCDSLVRSSTMTVYGDEIARAQALRAYWQGDPDAAERALTPRWSFLALPFLPAIRVSQGRIAEAETLLETLRPRLPADGGGGVWMLFVLGCVAALDALGRAAEGAIWYPGILRHRGWLLDWWLPETYLGIIAAATERWPEAFDHFERAIDFCDRERLVTLAAIARARFARSLVQRGKPGDRLRARDLLNTAIARFQARGMAVELRPAIALRDALARGRPVSRDAKYGLSDMQVRILALLAEGKSNREIGAALHLGTRTVDSHVSSILSKLGVKTRAAAAAKAVAEHIDGIIEIQPRHG